MASEWHEDPDLVAEVTEVVREADQEFLSAGGSTRHFVRDHLFPGLAAKGLRVVRERPDGE